MIDTIIIANSIENIENIEYTAIEKKDMEGDKYPDCFTNDRSKQFPLRSIYLHIPNNELQ
jgi:hypothetical protein